MNSIGVILLVKEVLMSVRQIDNFDQKEEFTDN